jgi:hypothetical protein
LTARFAGRSHESVSRSNRERSNLSALIINNRMGIDIYAQWDGMTAQEEAAQVTGFSIEHGHVGYLREAYHGEPYATKVLVPEAFESGRAPIDASTLQERLPEALHIAETREREVYGVTDAEDIERVQKSYRDFVALCVRKEDETGQPCLIIASY